MKRRDKFYIGTNTKMYKTIPDTVSFISSLQDATASVSRENMELFVIPSYTTLDRASATIKDNLITLGAQNVHWEDEGQFTGEISPLMLKEVGVTLVELGHSERRHVMGEDDHQINKKVVNSLKNAFTVLLCIGETMEQKDYGLSDETLATQLKIGLSGVSKNQISNVMIAYEPVWAIGVAGIPARKEYADEKHKHIRSVLVELYSELGEDVPILYGGSVNNENASELTQMPFIDGLFIGRSAWVPDNFLKIIDETLPLFMSKREG